MKPSCSPNRLNPCLIMFNRESLCVMHLTSVHTLNKCAYEYVPVWRRYCNDVSILNWIILSNHYCLNTLQNIWNSNFKCCGKRINFWMEEMDEVYLSVKTENSKIVLETSVDISKNWRKSFSLYNYNQLKKQMLKGQHRDMETFIRNYASVTQRVKSLNSLSML